MSSNAELLLEEYKAKGALIDANLLLLYLVGSFNIRLVGDGKYNKLSKYTSEDFELLLQFRLLFRTMVTTPHVLTEVSNLTGDLPERTRANCFKHFGIAFIGIEELPLASFELAQRSEFSYLGLTDSGLAHLSSKYLIVSDDLRMISHLNQLGLKALNFNHLRGHLLQ